MAPAPNPGPSATTLAAGLAAIGFWRLSAVAAPHMAALAHREGSILFVDPEMCQEHTFDNWTGSIAFRETVDCDARLAGLRKSETERAAERMRSVAEGFRR